MNVGSPNTPAPEGAANASEVRFRLLIHYVGSGYHGWQYQPELPTVQGALEEVLRKVTQRHCPVVGSGRTDSGVHATGQVASVQLPDRWTPAKLRGALNGLLPHDIWVADVRRAQADFHPRFDAIDRTYLYRIGVDECAKSPFRRSMCWALGKSVDLDAMRAASNQVVGDHSFRAFAKAGQPERGERCTVHTAQWAEYPGGVHWTVTANRYLHHMVRYLVGTMVDIGLGKRPLDDVARLLGGAPGVTTSRPAPPEGLFLHHVRYPGDDSTPSFEFVDVPNSARPSHPPDPTA